MDKTFTKTFESENELSSRSIKFLMNQIDSKLVVSDNLDANAYFIISETTFIFHLKKGEKNDAKQPETLRKPAIISTVRTMHSRCFTMVGTVTWAS